VRVRDPLKSSWIPLQVRGMHPNQSKLESRVHRAAEAALSRQKYVSAIDVLCGMGLLATPHVDDWRKGRVDFLERVIQANLSKISSSMAIFRRWAGEKGLKPSGRPLQPITGALREAGRPRGNGRAREG
jgi:hypothetical protein